MIAAVLLATGAQTARLFACGLTTARLPVSGFADTPYAEQQKFRTGVAQIPMKHHGLPQRVRSSSHDVPWSKTFVKLL